MKQSDYNSASIDLTKAIALKPNKIKPLYLRPNAYKNLEKYTEAVEDINKVIQLKPDYAEAFLIRGISQFYLRKYLEADTDLKKAVSLNSKLQPNANTYFEKLKNHI